MQVMSDLDRLESELDDVETALACLSRSEPGLCDPCVAANDEGTLLVRPGLWACAEGRMAGAKAEMGGPVMVANTPEASESDTVEVSDAVEVAVVMDASEMGDTSEAPA